MKIKILQWILCIAGLVQITLWGLSHLFFPEWYLTVIAHKSPALLADPNVRMLVNELGGMAMGVGIVTILASIKPVKNINFIILLLLLSCFSMLVTLYYILIAQTSHEWGHILTVLIQAGIIVWLYPWKAGWEATYKSS